MPRVAVDGEVVACAAFVIERDEHVPAGLRDGAGARVVFVTDAAHVPESAQVAFPFGSFAERSGRLVNLDGRVQRLHATAEAGPTGVQSLADLVREILFELDTTYTPLADGGAEGQAEGVVATAASPAGVDA